MKGANNTYWGNIREGFSSLLEGLRLSIRHFFAARDKRAPYGIADNRYFGKKTGLVTLQYPHERIPVPDNGRYKLHNEIEDCIVCDKCAKICPVDCIEIEPVRAVEEIGKTSDGTSKRIYAARFDIDMGKCCFCGLCTTVCPTECLTMTSEYDFTEYDVDDHIFSFSEMTPLQILEKKSQWEAHQKAKQAPGQPATKPAGTAKPVLRPRPLQNPAPELKKGKDAPSGKPVFKPKVKPKTAGTEASDVAKKLMEEKSTGKGAAKPRPVFRPRVKPAENSNKTAGEKDPEEQAPDNPAGAAGTPKRPRPVINPQQQSKDKTKGEQTEQKSKQPGPARRKPGQGDQK